MPTRSREEYFNLPLKVDESSGTIGKMFVLVIYDISDNRRRASLAKILAGFGYRVQESAFEAMLTKGQLAKLVARIDRFAIDCDNIRIYKIRGVAAVLRKGTACQRRGVCVLLTSSAGIVTTRWTNCP